MTGWMQECMHVHGATPAAVLTSPTPPMTAPGSGRPRGPHARLLDWAPDTPVPVPCTRPSRAHTVSRRRAQRQRRGCPLTRPVTRPLRSLPPPRLPSSAGSHGRALCRSRSVSTPRSCPPTLTAASNATTSRHLASATSRCSSQRSSDTCLMSSSTRPQHA